MIKKDICNLALTYLDTEEQKFENIENIEDYNTLTKEERACLRMYNTSILNFLASYQWSFAKKRKKLTEEDLIKNEDDKYLVYKKPDDLNTLIKVNGSRNYYVKVIGNNILTYIENPIIEYITNDIDLEKVDDLVKSAISLNLALLISPMIFNDLEKQKILQYSLAAITDTLRTRDITEDMGDYLNV